MFFAWALKSKHRWLQKCLYWAELPLVLIPILGLFGIMIWIRTLIVALENPWAVRGLKIILSLVFLIIAARLGLYLLDRLFRYRTGDMVVLTLSRCPEDVSAAGLKLRRGALVAEMRLGEFYNYAKYWPLKLKPRELAPFVFLDAYRGALTLIEQVKSGRAPIDLRTPLMTTTIFLHAVKQAADHELAFHVTEEAVRGKSLLYCLAMGLSLRMNPFSSHIPEPGSGTKRVYFTAQAFLDHEDFFRQEVAKLSKLTQRILHRRARRKR